MLNNFISFNGLGGFNYSNALWKLKLKGGKKEAFLGGDVSEYIRANTTIKKQDCIRGTLEGSDRNIQQGGER